MTTYEMIGVADQNCRTYESKYGTYNKDKGFRLSYLCSEIGKAELLNKLLHENCWSLKQELKKMTKEEIEKELGYEIDIINPDNDKKHNKENDTMLMDEFMRMLGGL